MSRTTPEQREEIVRRYVDGESVTKLSKELGIQNQRIYGFLKRRGIKSRPIRKYNLQENLFEKIDSEDKAYWLGFLFAECTLDEKRYCLGINLGPDEREHLERFCFALQSSHPIQPIRKPRAAWSLKIGSKKLCKTLQAMGLGHGKTQNLKWPKLRQDMILHFIRGFLDGDGWITCWVNKKGKRSWSIGFASCSRGFLESLQQEINRFTGVEGGSISSRTYENPNWNDGHQLTYGGNKAVQRVGSVLYGKAHVFLPRKKMKFDEFLIARSSPVSRI